MMLHHWLRVWFEWVEHWGYLGVFVLMAMESSILPVPSEVVMPPAAFWAAQGRMSFAGVVLAGTLGSYFGSILNYGLARVLGFPLVKRYGKVFLFTEEKLLFAQRWVEQYGASGIFLARLLPVVRHLISIPAGILKMPVLPFSIATTVGAGLWCLVLSWFGEQVIGGHPELLQSPEAMVSVVKQKLSWFVGGVLLLGVLYAGVTAVRRKQRLVQELETPRA